VSISNQGNRPVMHVRIRSLRLRVSAGEARAAKALATTVVSKLALRVGDLSGTAGREVLRTRVMAPASASQGRLADAIVENITSGRAGKTGGR
jgi:hypothetical protein